MKINLSDINDDEIRIISAKSTNPKPDKRLKTILWVTAIVAIATIALISAVLCNSESDQEPIPAQIPAPQELAPTPIASPTEAAKPFTNVSDTVVNGIRLQILTPHHATPVLEIGPSVLADTTAVLAAQAADIRGDNGGIVGSFILHGQLMGKSESKAGFCAIVDGNITIGVADATPLFEQALNTGAYFFRQYPLVVAGQPVENKPKGRSLRKALAEIDGKTHIISSRDRLTFHDFAQALADAGVRNAIYLTGSKSYTCYTDPQGNRIVSNQAWSEETPNINFIVWR